MKLFLHFFGSLVLLALTGCAAVPSAERSTLTSRTGLSLSFTPPAGWAGPARQTPPSYDQWSFRRDSCCITIRVDRATSDSASKLHRWLNASDGDVTASLREQWKSPRAETITYITSDALKMRIRAAHDVAGEQAWGNALIGQSELTFELDTDTAEQLSQYLPTFLAFARSVRIEQQSPATRKA